MVFAVAEANCFMRSGFVFSTWSKPGKLLLNMVFVRCNMNPLQVRAISKRNSGAILDLLLYFW